MSGAPGDSSFIRCKIYFLEKRTWLGLSGWDKVQTVILKGVTSSLGDKPHKHSSMDCQ